MGTFTIFVIGLTFLYVVYYAYIITKDMYGRKDDSKSEEEDIDVSGMEADDSPCVITEDTCDTSLSGDYTVQVSEDGLRIFSPSDSGTADTASEKPEDNRHKPTSAELNESISVYAEDCAPGYSVVMEQEEFSDFIINQHVNNKRNMEKSYVRDKI